MGRVGHNNMGASNALYDRSLLDWRKAQKTKASFGGTGVASMKVGDLVKLLDDPKVQEDNSELRYDAVGIVTQVEYPGYEGRPAAWVQFVDQPRQTSLWIKELEIVSESR